MYQNEKRACSARKNYCFFSLNMRFVAFSFSLSLSLSLIPVNLRYIATKKKKKIGCMPSLVQSVSNIVTKKLKTDIVHYEILSQLSQGRGRIYSQSITSY